MCLPFWSLFQESLTASPHIETADSPTPATEWNVAKSIFAELVRRLRAKCMFPPQDGTGGGGGAGGVGWMKDQEQQFRMYRNQVGDAIVTA
jgi:hypothetical protein